MIKEKKLVWSRLKSMLCPKCGSYIKEDKNAKAYACTNPKCDFRITNERFYELVNDLYKPRHDQLLVEE